MSDRELIRRDAEDSVRDVGFHALTEHIFSLLAELEQADKQRYARLARLAHVERERDEATDAWQLEIKRALAAEARLAKADTVLVEALREITCMASPGDLMLNPWARAAHTIAAHALADWEQT